MEKYKIISITNLDGTPRTDRFYPDIVNQVIELPYGLPQLGGKIYGIVIEKPILTSRVQALSGYGNVVKIETRNTIYQFEKVED